MTTFADLLAEPVRNGVYKPSEFHGRGCKIVNMGELFAHPRLRDVDMRRIELTDDERRRFHLQAGDLLFARRSLVAEGAGKCAIVMDVSEGGTTFESSLIRARPDQRRADSLFLYYWFSSPVGTHALGTIRRQVAVAGITGSDLSQLYLTVPPVSEQRAIARILGALDDKIELNRRTNETLEAMARALFQSWFVDFDPVRAKMEGRQPEGMDAETAKLFASKLVVTSEGEPTPEGWGLRPICEYGDLFDGPHATPPESMDGAVFLGIRNFRPTSLDLSEIRHIAETDFARWTKRVQPTEDDIVFTYEATLGFFALIPPNIRCCLGRRTALFRPTNRNSTWFHFHWFTSPPFQRFLERHKQPGSTVDRIWLKDFPQYPMLTVPPPLEARFTVLARSNWKEIHARQAESRTLTALRDTLLPKLLSGELRVPEAEKAVSAVL